MAFHNETAGGVNLREVLPEAELFGASELRVASCSADSRCCRPGDLFVALPGTQTDGHEHVAEAIQRGAVAVVASRPMRGCTVPVAYVTDTRAAYGRICQALMRYPARQVKTIGITGTNGKTTTSWLTAAVLEAGGYASSVCGTLGLYDGLDTEITSWTTPPAHVLADWLARSQANGCSHAVMEVSSHALTQARVEGVDLDVACVTNVRHDHLDFHGTARAYRAAKARIFDHLAGEGFAIINLDDAGAASLLPLVDGPVLTVGIDAPAELTALPLEGYASEQTYLLMSGSESIPVRTPLVGRHNISNGLIAAAVGLVYGIPLEAIVRGLESVKYVPGRLERIECGQPFHVFVDYAHTPDALTGVLEALRGVTAGRIICVMGAGGQRDKAKRPLMGKAAEEAADLVVITNDNPRHESPVDVFQGLLSGCERPTDAHVIADRRSAIHWALAQAVPGDCVLIAGKGHERTQQIGDRFYLHDDREVAREFLYQQMLSGLPRAA